MRKGILAGGNWIIDQVKVTDRYPSEERVAYIVTESSSNGGAAYNVLKDLHKMGVPFPLEGVGLVGSDDKGNHIIKECQSMGINISQLKQTDKAPTSYTDVMSVKHTGKRTFFHHHGANALLDQSFFNLSLSGSRIFYLGYLLLLESLDIVDQKGVTGASKLLKEAVDKGFITAVDLVSEESERFKSVVPASLPYIDYLFVNEFEAEMLSGISTVDNDGNLLVNSCYDAVKKISKMGVRKWTILHSPKAVFAISKEGRKILQPSLKLPSDYILGTVGAGDALAAGVLTGIHEGWSMDESLKLGVCVAASSLSSVSASDGVLPYRDCLTLANEYGFHHI